MEQKQASSVHWSVNKLPQSRQPQEDLSNVGTTKLNADEYGRPIKGSKSERRGFQAEQHICKEQLELCTIITDFGKKLSPNNPNDCRIAITFGELFDIYVTISNKLVGMLLRARKHDIVDFKGEMLFQRRDDDVVITLLKPLEEIKHLYLDKISETQEVINSREAEKYRRH